MSVKRFKKDLRVERAIDEMDEETFIGETKKIEDEDLNEEITGEEEVEEENEKLLAIAIANGMEENKEQKPQNIKTTQEEKLKRIKEVLLLANKGFTYSEIIEYAKKRWIVSRRTAERYIRDARRVEAVNEKDIKNFRNDAISRCKYIYRLAVKNKNEAIALQAQKEINKLQGLYLEQVLLTQGNEDNPIKKLMEDVKTTALRADDIVDNVVMNDENETEE